MSQINSNLASIFRQSGMDEIERAWQAQTGREIAIEQDRAAHSWSADGFWKTSGKALGEIFSFGLYDAGPKSGVSAIGNFLNDNSIVSVRDLEMFNFREGMDPIGEPGTRDASGRLSIQPDSLSMSTTAGLRRSARFIDRAENGFVPNEAQIALYGTDDAGELFDEKTLADLADSNSEFEMAVRRGVALREKAVAIRRGSMSPAANFAVGFASGLTDPATLASGAIAGKIGGSIGGAFLQTTVEAGGTSIVLPGTASTIKNLVTRGLVAGGENIGQGAVLNALAGKEYGWNDAMRDMAFGTVFSTVFHGSAAVKESAAIRATARQLKDAAELMSMLDRGAEITEKGALYYQHVPGFTKTASMGDIAAAEYVAVQAMDHAEAAGGGKSSLGWLIGREAVMDGIGPVKVTGVEVRRTPGGRIVQEVIGDAGGREVRMDASGVAIDRYEPMQPGTRVRLDDGTLGKVDTLVSESTPLGEATRVPRRGDADAMVKVVTDDGRTLTLKPQELLAKSGTAIVRRGQVVFDPANAQRAVIAFGKAKDASTLVHEPGHVFRRTLREIDADSAEAMNQHYGQTGDRWTVESEERFARDFELYLSEGKAPTKELTGVFERFAVWLRDLWEAIGGKKSDLTDAQRQAFGKLLDADQMKPINGELGGRFKATRDQLRQVLGDNEQSRSVEALMLANAKAWSRATGRNIDEYFSDVIAGFTGSLRNPFTAPIRALPGPKPIIAKGRPAGYVNAYIEGLVRHADMPARAQREAQLMGLSDPEDARAKWRAGLAEKAAIDSAARAELLDQARRESHETDASNAAAEAANAIDQAAAKDAAVRERMAVVARAIDTDRTRALFDSDRVASIQADIGIKARSWLFQNKSEHVRVVASQRETVRFNPDGTLSVNHTFVHMMPADRLAAFNTPLMHLELLRDAVESGVRPDSPDLAGFIESYGFGKTDADLHAVAVGRLFRAIERRTHQGEVNAVGMVRGQPPKAEPKAVIPQQVATLEAVDTTAPMSFSRDAIEDRILEIGKALTPDSAMEDALARGRTEHDEHYNEDRVSFSFPDELPTEIREALEGEPQYVKDQFNANVPGARGADTISEIGVDAMLQIAREGNSSTTRLFYDRSADGKLVWSRRDVLSSGERMRLVDKAKQAIAAAGDPNGALLAWMHDNPTVRTMRTLLKPQEVGTGALLKINGKQFEVQDTKQGWRELVGINGNEGVRIPFEGIEVVPADAGSFIQGNRWRGPKPVKEAAADAAPAPEPQPEPVEIPPERDLPPMAVTTGGGTLPPVDPAMSLLHLSEDAPFRTKPSDFEGTHELAQDQLDLAEVINSEDANGQLPLGGTRGGGATGGRGVRIGAAPRIDRVGILKGMDHPLTNVVTNALFEDAVLDSQGKRSNANAEQFTLTNTHTIVDGYLRQMSDVLKGATKDAGIGRVNIPARFKFEKQFRDAVGRLVRDPQATPQSIADPHLRKAVELTRETLRRVGQLGKENHVKGFDKFALDDNYLTRVWDFELLHKMEKSVGVSAVHDLFEQSVLDARPNLTRAEARIVGQALHKKLFTYGKEAGIDRNAFAAGLSNREHLLRVLKEQNVDIATATAIADKVAIDRDGSGLISVAKRRTLLNEKAQITTGSGQVLRIEDLLNNDAMAIVHRYGQQVIAEAAMAQVRRQLGAKVGLEFDNDAGMLSFLVQDMRDAGYSQPEINKAAYLIDTGIKRLRGVATEDSGFWTDNAWRVRQFAATVGNGAFGIPAMFELGHAITRLGVRASLANMPAVWKAWRAMRRGEVNDPALKAVLYTIGIGHDTVTSRYFGAFDHGGDAYQTSAEGRLAQIDKGLAAAAKGSRFISGVPQITEFSRLMAANGVQHKIVQQALNGKMPSARRLAWLGMDQTRWNAVAAEISAHHRKGPGGLVDVDLDGWTDMQAKHDYIEAVRSSVNTIIQEGGIGASHPWLESELGKLLFQFRQFGIMAYNRQTLAQYQIGDSEAIGRGMVAAVPFGMMQYLAGTYLNGLGRNDRDEYYAKALTPGRMAIAAFSRASFSSIGPVVYDTFAASLGMETLGGFRASGLESDPLLGNPTFAIYSAGRKGVGGAIRSVFDPNYDLSDENIRGIRSVVPFSRLPGSSLLWNSIMNQTPSHSIQRVDEP